MGSITSGNAVGKINVRRIEPQAKGAPPVVRRITIHAPLPGMTEKIQQVRGERQIAVAGGFVLVEGDARLIWHLPGDVSLGDALRVS